MYSVFEEFGIVFKKRNSVHIRLKKSMVNRLFWISELEAIIFEVYTKKQIEYGKSNGRLG